MPTPTSLAPTITLSNGVEMPQLGLGTWPMDDAEAARVVAQAIGMGYRLIDTAENYGNERGVGEGLRASGVPREQVFITTKFNKQWHSVEGAQQACDASLLRLGLDHVDLLLVHWPNPDQDRYVEAFEGLVRLLEAGKVRAIGTSNFKPTHLQRLFDLGLVPHVNQIHLDPYHGRHDVVQVHRERGIVTEAWSHWAVPAPCCRSRTFWLRPSAMAAQRGKWCCAGIPSRAMCRFRSLPIRCVWPRTWTCSASRCQTGKWQR